MTHRLGPTERLQACLVREDGTIADAMRSIDRGAGQIALAVDAAGRLVGVVTDGDVRRALLGGASLEQPLAAVVTRQFVAVRDSEQRAAATELMRARRLDAIPVVDAEGRPVGLHLLHEFLEPVERRNWAVLMAGGQGQRLRPLTNDVPKPMLRVAGRPILERLVLHLVGFGIKRIFISVNYLGQVIEQHFGDGEAFGCRIEYLREEMPLGTAGSLSLLPETPAEPLLVLNGDLVTSADLGALLGTHTAGGYAATLGIYRYLHTIPFGCVDRDGARVTALHEKPTVARDVNSGIYALEPSALARLEPGVPATMPALVDRLLSAGEPVGAFDIDEDWIDVGHRDQLARARDGG